MLFQEGDRVRVEATNRAGVIRHVVDTPKGKLYHVYMSREYGPNFAWRWKPAYKLSSAADEVWSRYYMERFYGQLYPVCHIDATGHPDMCEIESDVQEMRRQERSTYVTHIELVRKTKHKHPIGCVGVFHSDRIRSSNAPRPCTIISQDVRYSWNGYMDGAYTVQFKDGSIRSYVMGLQFVAA